MRQGLITVGLIAFAFALILTMIVAVIYAFDWLKGLYQQVGTDALGGGMLSVVTLVVAAVLTLIFVAHATDKENET